MKSIIDFAEASVLRTDVGKAFEAAFLAGCREIWVPEGTYRLEGTIEVPSDTRIELDPKALIIAASGKAPARRMHMIANRDPEKGDRNITIRGGIFDGNCGENARESYKDPGFIGLMFDFRNVDGLTLEDIEAKNASSYHFRLGGVKNFAIRRIRFTGLLTPLCQDGIHVCGPSEHGEITDIYAVPGSMGDDLIALNADDDYKYPHNWGLVPGYIRDVHVKNVVAEDCFTGVRLLSIREEIADCSFSDMRIGFREHGVNMDATRYCMDPLFDNDAYPEGVGAIRNLRMENVTMWKTTPGRPVFTFETNCDHFVVKNFRRLREKEPENDAPTLLLRNLAKSRVTVNGEEQIQLPGETAAFDPDCMDLVVERICGD